MTEQLPHREREAVLGHGRQEGPDEEVPKAVQGPGEGEAHLGVVLLVVFANDLLEAVEGQREGFRPTLGGPDDRLQQRPPPAAATSRMLLAACPGLVIRLHVEVHEVFGAHLREGMLREDLERHGVGLRVEVITQGPTWGLNLEADHEPLQHQDEVLRALGRSSEEPAHHSQEGLLLDRAADACGQHSEVVDLTLQDQEDLLVPREPADEFGVLRRRVHGRCAEPLYKAQVVVQRLVELGLQ
mmetsp:Transcript_38901/g.124822  ORF Transcript_38901/g.124822 Transcript_38901/m.124822 type:complete len:242 (+) Transcript_38901:1698-2423(+)